MEILKTFTTDCGREFNVIHTCKAYIGRGFSLLNDRNEIVLRMMADKTMMTPTVSDDRMGVGLYANRFKMFNAFKAVWSEASITSDLKNRDYLYIDKSDSKEAEIFENITRYINALVLPN